MGPAGIGRPRRRTGRGGVVAGPRWRSWPAMRSCGPRCEDRLTLRWSPQQISGWLREEFPGRAEMQVSHETIYLSLFVQGRGSLRKELTAYLRRGHATRRPRGYSSYNGQGKLRDVLHISQRPAEAEDRAVPGIGKVTCCWAPPRRASPPWWNASPGS